MSIQRRAYLWGCGKRHLGVDFYPRVVQIVSTEVSPKVTNVDCGSARVTEYGCLIKRGLPHPGVGLWNFNVKERQAGCNGWCLEQW